MQPVLTALSTALAAMSMVVAGIAVNGNATATPVPQASAVQQEIEVLTGHLSRIEQSISRIEETLTKSREDLARATARIDALAERVNALEQELRRAPRR
jgi:septal ring factor EnvC (AmiA/AmiB activator)